MKRTVSVLVCKLKLTPADFNAPVFSLLLLNRLMQFQRNRPIPSQYKMLAAIHQAGSDQGRHYQTQHEHFIDRRPAATGYSLFWWGVAEQPPWPEYKEIVYQCKGESLVHMKGEAILLAESRYCNLLCTVKYKNTSHLKPAFCSQFIKCRQFQPTYKCNEN